MSEKRLFSKKVVIKTQRKDRYRNKKDGRIGSTGKKGIIYSCASDGTETELVKISAPTFKALSRLLRKTGLIPVNLVLKHNGVTEF